MTETVRLQRHTVNVSGFANPLTLEANAEADGDVEVYADEQLLVLGVDYDLDGVGDTGDLDAIDGVEVTILDVPAWASFDTFTVVHNPPLDQNADLSAGGKFGQAFENAVDAIVRRLQAVGSRIDRALHLPVDATGVDVAIPLPDPGKALKWNAAGTALENSTVDPDTGDVDIDQIVDAVQPIVESNLATAITAAEAATAADVITTAASAAAGAASAVAADASADLAEIARIAAEAAAGANSTVAVQILAAATTSTPANGDLFGIVDVSAANVLKGWTFTVVKAFLKIYNDTLYSVVGHTHTFASLTSKPTTRLGYGITDAMASTLTTGSVGSYAICTRINNGGVAAPGDTTSGSNLRYANTEGGPPSGHTPSGTWRCMGDTGDGGSGDQATTLWHRYA